MHNLCVFSQFKNEAHILEEWLLHYIHRGVDHFFLINDASTDNYMEIVNKYSKYITLIQNEISTKNVGRQILIYDTYFKKHLSDTKWVISIDLDEFLFSYNTINLKDVLQKYDNYSQIIVDWLHFGSNDHIYQPNSVVEGFTMRANFDTSKFYYSYKSIFKADKLIKFDIHRHVVNGPTVHIKYSDSCDLIINHYSVQSLEFFMNVKATRGDINNYFEQINKKRDETYFTDSDVNDVVDRRLYCQNYPIFKEVKLNKIDLNKDLVTMVMTSCNRPDLLSKTLSSFIEKNTFTLDKFIIIDDSGKIDCNKEVIEKFNDRLEIISIYNKVNIGQIRSIDKAYSYVKTKYVFHCEEDWLFTKPGFIEDSMKVFESMPNEKIFTVWLRPHNCTSLHPIIRDDKNRGFFEMKRDFTYIHKNEIYTWCGFTFNPGLRKTEDLYTVHPYIDKCKMKKVGNKEYPENGEYKINQLYASLGFYSVILDDPKGYVNHIGWDQHIKTP